MLWDRYVFRQDDDIHDLWDDLFNNSPVRLLYITGNGFDVRAQEVLGQLANNIKSPNRTIEKAELLLVSFKGYELDQDVIDLTKDNERILRELFSEIGTVAEVVFDDVVANEDDASPSMVLSSGTSKVLDHISGYTDIILDCSSLPRVAYLSLATGILNRLVPNKDDIAADPHPLLANNVNFQIVVAEDANLDGKISAENPSNELVLIPGFSSVMQAESVRDWPMVWFIVLGENKSEQFKLLMSLAEVPDHAEVCPVLPHPSSNPRRADDLLVEYADHLFSVRLDSINNTMHVSENNPFEVYRQLYRAMQRYKSSMNILGGCRLLVSPLGSKLVTIGVGLACYEIRAKDLEAGYGVAIPLTESKRYSVSVEELKQSKSTISALLLTGEAYQY